MKYQRYLTFPEMFINTDLTSFLVKKGIFLPFCSLPPPPSPWPLLTPPSLHSQHVLSQMLFRWVVYPSVVHQKNTFTTIFCIISSTKLFVSFSFVFCLFLVFPFFCAALVIFVKMPKFLFSSVFKIIISKQSTPFFTIF